jgi:hypothetical protein
MMEFQVEEVWPTWLKVMENGSLGEARTRAFLIDRFWVLERSVDTDGADFLIQRRTTTQRFTDHVPPRVGVIQAKFFQDGRTTHRILKNYVVDQSEKPLEGFFALLHVGKEDDGEMYLLSAAEIVESLPLSTAQGPESFVLGKAALASDFRVRSRRLALDRIEHSLKSQTYSQSAAFFDRLNIPFRKFGEDDIDFEWTLPLPNPVGEIPKMFLDEKERLRSIVYEMEEVLEVIDSILIEKDPRKALSHVDDLSAHIDGHGNLSFGNRLHRSWGDFPNALDAHDRARRELDKDGLLACYISMGEQLRAALDSCAASSPLLQPEDFLVVDLEYDRETLAVARLLVTSSSGEKPEAIETPGYIRVWRGIDGYRPRRTRPVDYLIDNLWWQAMRYVIEERYPDED